MVTDYDNPWFHLYVKQECTDFCGSPIKDRIPINIECNQLFRKEENQHKSNKVFITIIEQHIKPTQCIVAHSHFISQGWWYKKLPRNQIKPGWMHFAMSLSPDIQKHDQCCFRHTPGLNLTERDHSNPLHSFSVCTEHFCPRQKWIFLLPIKESLMMASQLKYLRVPLFYWPYSFLRPKQINLE